MVRIVLPAYNEESSLPELLDGLSVMLAQSNVAGEVILVNDGSTDRTLEIGGSFISKLKLRIVDLQPNRGLAIALKAGLEAALRVLEPMTLS